MPEKLRNACWNQSVKSVKDNTTIIDNESEHETRKRRETLENDPEEWFKYYFPKYTYAPPAAFHKEATNRVVGNKEWYEVRMWSRELAKSTRTMMEVLYLTLAGHPSHTSSLPHSLTEQPPHTSSLPYSFTQQPPHTSSLPHSFTQQPSHTSSLPYSLTEQPPHTSSLPHSFTQQPPHTSPLHHSFTKKKYVLMISNSLDNAVRLLLPYKLNLQYNKRIIKDYGIQENQGNWQMEEFTTQGGVAFRAIGVGQSPRGARNEEVRPDILLFDDVDTDTDCLNPEIIAKKWRWIEEAAIGTRSISQPTTIIFCGNRIAVDCCIGRATSFADHMDIVNIRDENGHSTWPEKNSEQDIRRVLAQKSYAAIQKEYFNNPVSEGVVFKQMAYKTAMPLSEYKFLVCYTDPSYKATNDYKATVLVGKYRQEYHIIKCFLDQTTTADLINWHYQVMDLVKGCICYYYMEEVFMQDVLVREVSEAGLKTGRTIPIRGDKRKKPDKFMRIESLLEPLNRNGQLYLNENERENPHMQRLEKQFSHFAPGSRAHDDGPDAVEGAVWQIINKESRGIREGIIIFKRPENGKRL